MVLRSSTLVIQSAFRRWRRHKKAITNKCCHNIARAFREWRVQKRAQEERAAVVIQSWYRMHRESQKYIHLRSCVIIIQARFRCFQAQKLYTRTRESIPDSAEALERTWKEGWAHRLFAETGCSHPAGCFQGRAVTYASRSGPLVSYSRAGEWDRTDSGFKINIRKTSSGCRHT